MLCWIDARQPFFFPFFFSHDVHETTTYTHTTSSRETALLRGRRGTTDPGNFEKRDTNNNHHTTTAFTEGPGQAHIFGRRRRAYLFYLFC